MTTMYPGKRTFRRLGHWIFLLIIFVSGCDSGGGTTSTGIGGPGKTYTLMGEVSGGTKGAQTVIQVGREFVTADPEGEFELVIFFLIWLRSRLEFASRRVENLG